MGSAGAFEKDPCHFEPQLMCHLGVSKNGGPQNGPQYTLILFIRTLEEGPLIRGICFAATCPRSRVSETDCRRQCEGRDLGSPVPLD